MRRRSDGERRCDYLQSPVLICCRFLLAGSAGVAIKGAFGVRAWAMISGLARYIVIALDRFVVLSNIQGFTCSPRSVTRSRVASRSTSAKS